MKNEKSNEGRVLQSGIEIKPLYTSEDIKHIDLNDTPGQYPYTRGIYSGMYRKRPWTIRQYAGVECSDKANELFKGLIKQGNTGLSLALDLPTQIGLDSDNEWAFPEVGGVGVPIDTLRDIGILFDGIDLHEISVSITVNASTSVIMAMFCAFAEEKGFDLQRLTGTLQNDVLKEYISRGTWIFPLDPSMKLAADVIEFCTRKVPNFNPINICGYHLREAGANAVQEIAYSILSARAHIDETIKRGLSIDEFGHRISFAGIAGMNIFEEAAKYRAARRMWSKIMKEQYGATKPQVMRAKFGVGIAASALTAEQPLNNLARASLMALGALLGGIQSLHVSTYDEAYAIPTEEAITLSIRTQQILLNETGITDTIDPLGGSFYVETLTSEIEKRVYEEIERIETKYGGLLQAISGGHIQKEIYEQCYEKEKQIRNGKKKIVGKNCFIQEGEEYHLELKKWNEDAPRMQVESLKKVKEERNQKAVEEGLSHLRASIEKGENLIPTLIDVVKTYATLGEIISVMKEYYGEFEQV